MKPILLADEAVTLIRQLGARTAAQLQQHLPAHTEDELTAALRSAARREVLTELPGGAFAYSCTAAQEAGEEEDTDPSTIVARALRARSVLELGWCGALAA